MGTCGRVNGCDAIKSFGDFRLAGQRDDVDVCGPCLAGIKSHQPPLVAFEISRVGQVGRRFDSRHVAVGGGDGVFPESETGKRRDGELEGDTVSGFRIVKHNHREAIRICGELEKIALFDITGLGWGENVPVGNVGGGMGIGGDDPAGGCCQSTAGFQKRAANIRVVEDLEVGRRSREVGDSVENGQAVGAGVGGDR